MAGRILVVEADRQLATELQRNLQDLGYQIAGAAFDVAGAHEEVTKLRPDLVLMDVALQDRRDGIEAAHWIRSHVDLPIVFVVKSANDELMPEIANPMAYVPAGCSPHELHSAVEFAFYRHQSESRLRRMANNLSECLNYLEKEILEKVETDPEKRVPEGFSTLSKREIEMLQYFLRGFGTSTIGARLRVSTQTVRNHLKNVCRKLRVHSQVELRELFADYEP